MMVIGRSLHGLLSCRWGVQLGHFTTDGSVPVLVCATCPSASVWRVLTTTSYRSRGIYLSRVQVLDAPDPHNRTLSIRHCRLFLGGIRLHCTRSLSVSDGEEVEAASVRETRHRSKVLRLGLASPSRRKATGILEVDEPRSTPLVEKGKVVLLRSEVTRGQDTKQERTVAIGGYHACRNSSAEEAA